MTDQARRLGQSLLSAKIVTLLWGVIPIMLLVAVEGSYLCHLDDWFRVGELLAGVDFRDDRNVLTLADAISRSASRSVTLCSAKNSLTHSTSHLLLIAIHVGGIYDIQHPH